MRKQAFAALALLALAAPARAEEQAAEEQAEVLPRTRLFDPLLADPRWPHFSAAVQDYGGDAGVGTAGAVSLGNGFSLYQAPGLGGTWGVGVQAAVFALFDLEAESMDLINADYWLGIPFTWRSGPWSAMARVFHQSSHLGDEYLLRSQTNRRSRVNLSYEAVDLRVSREFLDKVVRVYAGGGYIFDKEPSDLDPGFAQWGVELRGPWRFANERLRPIAAVDFQSTEETGWDVDVSTRAGVELTSTVDRDYTLQFTLEYYRGRNPNGQIYTDAAEFYGFGVHAYF